MSQLVARDWVFLEDVASCRAKRSAEPQEDSQDPETTPDHVCGCPVESEAGPGFTPDLLCELR